MNGQGDAPSPGQPVATFRRLRRITLIAVIGVILAFAFVQAGDGWRGYTTALREAERRAERQVVLATEHVRLLVAAIDATLTQIAVASRRLGGPEGSATDWGNVLAGAFAGTSGIGSLTIVDPEGVIRHSTIAQIVGQSRRDQFVVGELARNPDAGLVADTPFKSLVNNEMLIPLGRRLAGEPGNFRGSVVATMRISQLSELYRSMDLGTGGFIRILHPDGQILFREPDPGLSVGSRAANDAVHQAYRDGRTRGAVTESLGGAPYVTAFRTLPQPGMILAVSLSRDSMLAEWRRDVTVDAIMFAGIALVLIAAGAFVLRAIKDREQAELQLLQAQKMEAVGQLTGGVAHDFNNILTVIIGSVEYLADLVKDDPQARRMADSVRAAAERGADLTKNLLAFARRQPLRPAVVDLNTLVSETDQLLRRTLGEPVELVTRLGREVWPTEVDPSQLQTALVNLALNARDAMPNGGRLTIETQNAVLDAAYARHNADVTPGDYVMLAVSDSGAGIPKSDLERVFEPFFTTKEAGKGSGLGLSMVYGLTKQSGGHIKIYSEVGQGTTVRLYLPRGRTAGTADAAAATAKEIVMGSETILVVEDDPLVREFVVGQLDALGYATEVAENAAEALARLDKMERVDLLFCDVILTGGVNGKQLADEAVRRKPGLKVLFTSGYTEDAIMHNGRLDPGVLLLTKPYRMADLARMVRLAIAGEKAE
jgi:signal transduction histidine kinase/ActR/RegA family two-component response regulator